MKKLLICAAALCAVAIVGCSKSNKAENDNAANELPDNGGTVLPAGFVVEGEQLLDSAGNVIATVVDGAYVDAKGNIIGTVEAVQDKYNEIQENVKNKSAEVVDSVKNVAANVKDGVENKAKEVVGNVKDAGAKAVDDVKKGVADKLDEGAAALKNQAEKLNN